MLIQNIMQNDEIMNFDVVVVGAGPAGLSAAIKIKQQSIADNIEIDICIIEKSAEIGGHIVSGAVFEPTALNELIPDWLQKDYPITTKVNADETYFFDSQYSKSKVPNWMLPKIMHNSGNYIISLGQLCKKLSQEAEDLGINIFSGFSASDLITDENDNLLGVSTGEIGLNRFGQKKSSYVPKINIISKYTIFAEGCRGSLGKKLIQKYNLDKDKIQEHYSLGIKEIWQIDKSKHRNGLVMHTIGWPLSENLATGGGAIYHYGEDLVSIMLITDLSYKNPYISPFDEMQRYKTHILISELLKNGKRISYAAKTITKGGLQSQIKMTFPGGVLIGDEASSLNFAKKKGIHTAMKSGMLVAKPIIDALKSGRSNDELVDYNLYYKKSWLYDELYKQRNFYPVLTNLTSTFGAKIGGALTSLYGIIDLSIFNGTLPWTLKVNQFDYQTLNKSKDSKIINYPRADNVLIFDRSSSVYLSCISHNEDQPNHLQINDENVSTKINLAEYGEPAQYYCPAGVYEIVWKQIGQEERKPHLQINSQNCIHCKTCDIKDPSQNINWTPPEGGSGPNYSDM